MDCQTQFWFLRVIGGALLHYPESHIDIHPCGENWQHPIASQLKASRIVGVALLHRSE